MKISSIVVFTFLMLAAQAASPKGWTVAGSAPQDYEFGTDESPPADGGKSAFIKAKPGAAASGFATLMQMVAADDYRGTRWKLSARMRTSDAAKAQLWMRIDGPDGKPSAFDNMNNRPVVGTTGWKRYEIVLDVAPDSVAVAFGFFLAGGGGVWADDFKLERVPASTPLTGGGTQQPRQPANLNFEQ